MKQQMGIAATLALLSVISMTAGARQITIDSLPALIPSTPIPGSQRTPSDFNGDGFSDLAWVNPFTGQFAYWLMRIGTTGQLERFGSRTFQVNDGYFVAAVGDVNGDGFSDLVFTSAKRDLYVWENDRSGRFVSRYLATYPEGWQLLGAGDVDGDGQDDLLWHDVDGCQVGIWLMRGGRRVGLRSQVVDCGYSAIAMGYFTPSNRISIVRTSDLHDIQMLDSTPDGFVASDVTPFVSGKTLIGLGGGVAGLGIMAEYRSPYLDGDYGTFGSYEVLAREFDVEGRQSGFSWVESWYDFTDIPWGVGGALVAGRSSSGASLIQSYGNDAIEACAPGKTAAPYHSDCTRFTYPRGWFVVGAPANGAGALGAEMTP